MIEMSLTLEVGILRCHLPESLLSRRGTRRLWRVRVRLQKAKAFRGSGITYHDQRVYAATVLGQMSRPYQ